MINFLLEINYFQVTNVLMMPVIARKLLLRYKISLKMSHVFKNIHENFIENLLLSSY